MKTIQMTVLAALLAITAISCKSKSERAWDGAKDSAEEAADDAADAAKKTGKAVKEAAKEAKDRVTE